MNLLETSTSKSALSSRLQLLEAGAVLFAKHGLEGTSVRDIAQKAGTNVCMISYHFGGKENLYRECLAEYGRLRTEAIKGLLDPPSSVEEFKVRLRLFVASLVESQAKYPEFSQILAKEIEAGLPVAADIFEKTFFKIMTDTIRFIQSAQHAGFVRKKLDPLFIAHSIYGTIGQVTRCDSISRRYFNCSIKDTKLREQMIDTLVEVTLSGVLN